MATRIEQHIQDHCHTAENVLLAAHKATEMRQHWFKQPIREVIPIPEVIEPIAVSEAPEPAIPRDWLYCAAQIPKYDKWPSTFIRHIKYAVAKTFDIDFNEISCNRRNRSSIIPRHVAFYLCKVLTNKSLPELGRKFGNRDHTTILHGIRATMQRMIADKDLCQTVVELQDRLERDLAEWRANV